MSALLLILNSSLFLPLLPHAAARRQTPSPAARARPLLGAAPRLQEVCGAGQLRGGGTPPGVGGPSDTPISGRRRCGSPGPSSRDSLPPFRASLPPFRASLPPFCSPPPPPAFAPCPCVPPAVCSDLRGRGQPGRRGTRREVYGEPPQEKGDACGVCVAGDELRLPSRGFTPGVARMRNQMLPPLPGHGGPVLRWGGSSCCNMREGLRAGLLEIYPSLRKTSFPTPIS